MFYFIIFFNAPKNCCKEEPKCVKNQSFVKLYRLSLPYRTADIMATNQTDWSSPKFFLCCVFADEPLMP